MSERDIEEARLVVDKLEDERMSAVRKIREAQSVLSQVNANLKQANLRLSSLESEKWNADERTRIELHKADRRELVLLHKCSAVFAHIEDRGIGFLPDEKRVIGELRQYEMQN